MHDFGTIRNVSHQKLSENTVLDSFFGHDKERPEEKNGKQVYDRDNILRVLVDFGIRDCYCTYYGNHKTSNSPVIGIYGCMDE